tara:strand:+ start:789 stop:977 length:189 start_codon:yes stop_codon:yes gene_type:complete
MTTSKSVIFNTPVEPDVDKIHNFVSSLEPKPINSLPDNPLNHLLVASFSAALLVVLFKLNFK